MTDIRTSGPQYLHVCVCMFFFKVEKFLHRFHFTTVPLQNCFLGRFLRPFFKKVFLLLIFGFDLHASSCGQPWCPGRQLHADLISRREELQKKEPSEFVDHVAIC